MLILFYFTISSDIINNQIEKTVAKVVFLSYDLFIFALIKLELLWNNKPIISVVSRYTDYGKRFNIGWDLRPDVNILSGINGVGKTTILNRSVGYLEELSGEMKSDEKNGVRLFFDNPPGNLYSL